jgi:CheY-like chemotaxis protein
MAKSLLLADDSTTIQKVVELALGQEDITVVCTKGADEALARARELRPDIIVADVFMPGKSGYDLAAAVRADPNLQHVPVLLLQSLNEPFDENRARSSGANGWIPKPFQSQILIDNVKQLLAAKPATTAPGPARPAPSPAASQPAAPAAAPMGQRVPTQIPPAKVPAPLPVAAPRPATPGPTSKPSVPPGAPAATTRPPPAPVAAAQARTAAAPAPAAPRPPGAPAPAAVARPAVPAGTPRPPGAPPAAPRPPGVPAPAGAVRAPGTPGPIAAGKPGVAPAPRPPGAPAPAPRPPAPALTAQNHEALLREALTKASKEMLERVIWEVVPELAETMIKEELQRLIKAREAK